MHLLGRTACVLGPETVQEDPYFAFSGTISISNWRKATFLGWGTRPALAAHSLYHNHTILHPAIDLGYEESSENAPNIPEVYAWLIVYS